MAAITVSTAAVLALHVVRADLPPLGHRLSEYATGRSGWLMAVAFVAMAAALIALAVGLAGSRPRGLLVVVVRRALVFAAVGLLLSAVFPSGATPEQEVIHSRASAVATVTLTVVAALWSWWSPAAADRDGRQRAIAVAVVLAALAAPVLHDTPLTGVGQRLLWALLVAWLVGAARRLRAP